MPKNPFESVYSSKDWNEKTDRNEMSEKTEKATALLDKTEPLNQPIKEQGRDYGAELGEMIQDKNQEQEYIDIDNLEFDFSEVPSKLDETVIFAPNEFELPPNPAQVRLDELSKQEMQDFRKEAITALNKQIAIEAIEVQEGKEVGSEAFSELARQSAEFFDIPQKTADQLTEDEIILLGLLTEKGAMGNVYEAYDAKNETYSVVKMIFDAPKKLEERFKNEIDAMKTIQSDAVIDVLSSGWSNQVAWFEMKKIEGTDLENILHEKGMLDFNDALDASLQIARGVQSIHEAGIIHRDLKPGNILLDQKENQYLIADFGLATLAGREKVQEMTDRVKLSWLREELEKISQEEEPEKAIESMNLGQESSERLKKILSLPEEKRSEELIEVASEIDPKKVGPSEDERKDWLAEQVKNINSGDDIELFYSQKLDEKSMIELLELSKKVKSRKIDLEKALTAPKSNAEKSVADKIDALSKRLYQQWLDLTGEYTVGTPMYMAPEAITGKGESEAVDVWAMGIIINNVFTGRNPFPRGESHLEFFKMVLKDEPKLGVLEQFKEPKLHTLVKSMLNKDPKRRPSMKEVISVLEQISKTTTKKEISPAVDREQLTGSETLEL